MACKVNITFLVVFAVGLLATAGDITITWTSPMYSKLESNNSDINPLDEPISKNEDALIGSLVNIGAIVGPFPFSFIADKIGRKITLLIIGVPHLVSYIMFAFANSVYYYYFGRVLGGLAVGGGYAVLPMYLAEISEDTNRGLLTTAMMVFWATGNLLPYVIGPFVSAMLYNIIMACFPLAFLILFLIVGVETPYYWLNNSEDEKAKKALMYLRSMDTEEIQPEYEHIKKNFKREEGVELIDILKNAALRKALFISLALIALQQLHGITAVGFYLQPIYDSSGTNLPSDVCSLVNGIVIFFASFIAPLLVERFNRKTIIIFSSSGTAFALIMLGTFFFIQESTSLSIDSLHWMPLFSLISFIIFFSSGMSCLPWTITSELFPTSCKQISSATVSSCCYLTSFLVTLSYNQMIAWITSAGVFWFYASWAIFTIFFTIFLVPETKDKSFREIQDIVGT